MAPTWKLTPFHGINTHTLAACQQPEGQY